jgi:DNA-binding transcriptional LysR family regulator
MHRDNLGQLGIFIAVADAGGFRQAARRLGLSSSAVSQSVARLEESLGTRLFERTTRSVQATPEGRRLYAEVAPALGTIRAAMDSGSGGTVRGSLRVTMPRLAARTLLADRLADFTAAYPDVQLEIDVDDGAADIVAAGFDAGVRLREQLDNDTISIPIGGPQRMVAVAAPALLDRHMRPIHPRDLLDLPCIALRLEDGSLYAWEFEKNGKAVKIAVQGPLILNDDDLVLAASRDGAGIAFLFEPMIADDLRAGRLVSLLDDWSPAFPGFHLYHTNRHRMRPPLRAFIDWLWR